MNREIELFQRISVLETQVQSLTETNEEIKGELDELLVLKNRGAGAFWLATTLFGTTLIGVLSLVINYFKG